MIKSNVVISAAGMGTRLGLDKPKCLVKINGKTLLQRQLEQTKDFETVIVVVGFKENEVIEEAQKYRPDIVIVRNPDYDRTSNAYSLSLGSEFLKDFLALDGDVLIPDKSFNEIKTHIKEKKSTVLFSTVPKTEDSVYMLIADNQNCIGFTRELEIAQKNTNYKEWSGCAYYNGITIPRDARYVFEAIIPSLPLPALNIECYEVDTPADLEQMKHLSI